MKHYDAFISYTHASEMPLATALDTALQRFAKPWNKLRAQKIYRDTDSQALTPNLLAAVQGAMDQSEFLILLASPESANSNWVPAEVEHWVKNRPLDRLLIVVCAGQVVWDDEAGDFDWDKTDCLPKTLKGVYEGQPLYLDMCWARGDEELRLRNARFKDAVARLSATLRGKSIEDMLGEEVIQFRRTTRIRNSAIAALSVLFIAASAAAYMAVQARDEAERQRVEAVHQRDQAIKNNLLNEVRNELNNNQLASAVQIARAARDKFGDDPMARRIAMEVVRHPTAVIHEFMDYDPDFASFSPDGSKLLLGFENDHGSLDFTIRNRFGGNEMDFNSSYGVKFLGDGSQLLTLEPGALAMMMVGDAEPEDASMMNSCDNFVEFRKSRNPAAVALDGGPLQGVAGAGVLDLQTGEQRSDIAAFWYGEPVQLCGSYVRTIGPTGEALGEFHVPDATRAAAGPDMQWFAVETADDVALVKAGGEITARLAGKEPAISPDGAIVATVVRNSYAFDFYKYTGRDAHNVEDGAMVDPEPGGIGFGYTILWDAQGREIGRLPGTHPYYALGGIFTAGGFRIDGMQDNHAHLWSLKPGPDGRHELLMTLENFAAVDSPDGRWVAVAEDEETIIRDREGRIHGVVEGEEPVFAPDQPIAMTLYYGRTRLWYLPRLRSESPGTVAALLGIAADNMVDGEYSTEERDCRAGCEPPAGYKVKTEGILSPMWSVTPGTINGGEEIELQISIMRGMPLEETPAGDADISLIKHRVAGCEVQSKTFHGKRMLLACGVDSSWRIYDLDAPGGIADTANHHADLSAEHGGDLTEAAFLPDGNRVISLSVDGLVSIWDISDGDPIPEPVDIQVKGEINTFDISPDSSLLVTTPFSGAVQLWNTRGELLATSPLPGAREEYVDARFYKDGKHVVITVIDSEGEFRYTTWTVDLDEMFKEFEWLPDLETAERERLGL